MELQQWDIHKRQSQSSYLHGAKYFLISQQSLSNARISQHFMNPEDLLLCSQEPALVSIMSQMNPVHIIPSYFFQDRQSHIKKVEK
jgi:hypothetical protein